MVPLSALVTPTDRGIRLTIDTAKLYAARTAAGLTQEQLAHRAGLTTATLCKIERGRQEPTARTVIALERELGVALDAVPAAPMARYRFTGWSAS